MEPKLKEFCVLDLYTRVLVFVASLTGPMLFCMFIKYRKIKEATMHCNHIHIEEMKKCIQ